MCGFRTGLWLICFVCRYEQKVLFLFSQMPQEATAVAGDDNDDCGGVGGGVVLVSAFQMSCVNMTVMCNLIWW